MRRYNIPSQERYKKSIRPGRKEKRRDRNRRLKRKRKKKKKKNPRKIKRDRKNQRIIDHLIMNNTQVVHEVEGEPFIDCCPSKLAVVVKQVGTARD